MTYKLPVFASIADAWHKVHGVKGVFFLGFLLMVLFDRMSHSLTNIVNAAVTPSFDLVMAALASVILSVMGTLLSMSMVYIGVERAYDKSIKATMLGYGFSFMLFIKLIGCYILIAIPLIVPLFFLFLPAQFSPEWGALTHWLAGLSYVLCIIFALYYIFLINRLFIAPTLVIVENLNPWAAIKRSYRLTKSNVWRLIGLTIFMIIMMMIGILTLGIGFIWTIPLTMILNGVIYRRFVESSGVV